MVGAVSVTEIDLQTNHHVVRMAAAVSSWDGRKISVAVVDHFGVVDRWGAQSGLVLDGGAPLGFV